MISKEELAAWVTRREQTLYGRKLLDRFFQGTVTAVAAGTPAQVQIQRISETVTDGAWYACLMSTQPLVGDRVQLVWLDDKVAVVIGVVTSVASSTLPGFSPYGMGLSTGNGVSGTPPSNPRLLIQAGTTVQATDGAAHMTITLPHAFPAGLLTCIGNPGDNTAGFAQVQWIAASCNTTQIQAWCGTNVGGGIANTTLRLNWIAVGW